MRGLRRFLLTLFVVGFVASGVHLDTASALTTSISVTAYGAKGDGVTDDAPAIQRALNAASPGSMVTIPPGTFMLGTSAGGVENFPDGSPIQSALIARTDGITIHGEPGQTVLKLKASKKMRVLSVVSHGVTIEGVTVDGNKSARNGTVPYPGGDLVDALVYGSSASSNMTVRSCTVRNGVEDGIGFWQSPNPSVYDCTSSDNGTVNAGAVGIAVSGNWNSGAQLLRNTIRNNTAAGIWVAFGASNVLVDGNLLEGNWGAGITTGGDSPTTTVLSSGLTIQNNIVRQNGSYGFAAISIYSAQQGTLSSNTIVDNMYDGVQFSDQGSIPSSSWNVTNNTCSNTATQRTQDYGIRVLGLSSGITLRGNTCSDNGSSLADQIVITDPLSVNEDWLTANTTTFTSLTQVVPTKGRRRH